MPRAVAAGSASRSGRTPTTSVGDGRCSGCPAASSTGARGGIVLRTASRIPGRRPGTMTLGLHCTFQADPVQRSPNRPVYVHTAPFSPRSTDAPNCARAAVPRWLI